MRGEREGEAHEVFGGGFITYSSLVGNRRGDAPQALSCIYGFARKSVGSIHDGHGPDIPISRLASRSVSDHDLNISWPKPGSRLAAASMIDSSPIDPGTAGLIGVAPA